MIRYSSAAGLALALWGLSGPARAGLIFDPVGISFPTYTGTALPGMDVMAHEVLLAGDRMIFFGRMAGPIAPTQDDRRVVPLRGGPRPGHAPIPRPAAPPVIGPNVLWDSVVQHQPERHRPVQQHRRRRDHPAEPGRHHASAATSSPPACP